MPGETTPTITPETPVSAQGAPDAGLAPPAPIVGGEPPVVEPALDTTGKPVVATPELGPDGKPITPAPKLDADGKPIEEPKPEDEKPEPRAPEEYAEFTLPEGTELDPEAMTEFKALARAQDLTQEQAQELLKFGGERIKAMAEAPYKLWAKTQAGWQAEVKADPEIGGTKFQDSVAAAALVFVPGEANPFVKNEVEAEGLKTALNTTGAGNNPAMVKFFVRLGTLLKEPGGLSGKPTNSSRQSLEEKMYPTMM